MIFIIFLILSSTSFVFAEDMSIKLNPSGFTPLSAVIELPFTNKLPVTVIVQGKRPNNTIATVYPPKTSDRLAIHGLYANYSNQVTIRFGDKRVIEQLLITPEVIITNYNKSNLPPMPIKSKLIINKDPQTNAFNYDLFFTSFPDSKDIIGLDQVGDLRYVFRDPEDKKVVTFHFSTEDNEVRMSYASDATYYVQRNLLGDIIYRKKYDIHHDSTQVPKGFEVSLANTQWGWEDGLFEIDSKKNVKRLIKIGDIFRAVTSKEDLPLLNQLIYDDKNQYTNTNNKPVRVDWAHGNSLVYDDKTKSILVSLRHLGVISVSYPDFKLNWFMTDDKHKITGEGFKYGQRPEGSLYLKDIPSLQKYRLKTPINFGPRGQHALLIKTNGNLLLFDNRSQGKSNPQGSRVLEYVIDTNKMQATIAREFEDRQKTYSRYVGDIDLSGKDHENILILYGFNKPRRILEVAPDNNVIYQLDIDVAGSVYRIDKYPLYPYTDKTKKYTIDAVEGKY